VLIGLEEKKVPYEGILISFAKREQKAPEFLKMNPR
jgi:glutathione S-transferase